MRAALVRPEPTFVPTEPPEKIRPSWRIWGLPLAIFNRIAEEAEDDGLDWRKADTTDHAAEDDPVEVCRIQQEDCMADEADDDTIKAHVALAETLEESRAEDGHDEDCDERLQEVQATVQRIIHEDVFASNTAESYR